MDRELEGLIWSRAGNRCKYCQMPDEYESGTFEIDHVIARAHGGPTRSSNLCLTCFICNSFKGTNLAGIDPKTKRVVLLFNPRRHKWIRHFPWAGPILIGRTPAGRATIATLRINLNHRIAYRRELIDEGVFPPN